MKSSNDLKKNLTLTLKLLNSFIDLIVKKYTLILSIERFNGIRFEDIDKFELSKEEGFSTRLRVS